MAKKYKTARALEKAIDKYFNGISHLEYVGVTDDSGLTRRVRSDSGDFIVKREFFLPPTISALCLFLGISRQTWSVYSDHVKNPEFAEVCDKAKLIIEVYLEEQLLSRRKGIQGIIFNLKNNYGWSDSSAIEIRSSQDIKNPIYDMSMEDKLKAIEAIKNDSIDKD